MVHTSSWGKWSAEVICGTIWVAFYSLFISLSEVCNHFFNGFDFEIFSEILVFDIPWVVVHCTKNYYASSFLNDCWLLFSKVRQHMSKLV